MANPRKFSEKIALHNQKQAEETAAFEAILREVSATTRQANAASQCQQQHPHIHLSQPNINIACRGRSLPNVNQMSSSSGIDLQSALSSLEDMKQAVNSGQTVTDRTQHRERSPQSQKKQFLLDRHRDCSPYGSVYLCPPTDGSWRRASSDSAIHSSVTTTSTQHLSGTGSMLLSNGPNENGTLVVSGGVVGMDFTQSLDSKTMSMVLRPRSCDVPGINIFPSPEPAGVQSGVVHVPIPCSTGSLPNLSDLNFSLPLTVPIDVDSACCGPGGGPVPTYSVADSSTVTQTGAGTVPLRLNRQMVPVPLVLLGGQNAPSEMNGSRSFELPNDDSDRIYHNYTALSDQKVHGQHEVSSSGTSPPSIVITDDLQHHVKVLDESDTVLSKSGHVRQNGRHAGNSFMPMHSIRWSQGPVNNFRDDHMDWKGLTQYGSINNAVVTTAHSPVSPLNSAQQSSAAVPSFVTLTGSQQHYAPAHVLYAVSHRSPHEASSSPGVGDSSPRAPSQLSPAAGSPQWFTHSPSPPSPSRLGDVPSGELSPAHATALQQQFQQFSMVPDDQKASSHSVPVSTGNVGVYSFAVPISPPLQQQHTMSISPHQQPAPAFVASQPVLASAGLVLVPANSLSAQPASAPVLWQVGSTNSQPALPIATDNPAFFRVAASAAAGGSSLPIIDNCPLVGSQPASFAPAGTEYIMQNVTSCQMISQPLDSITVAGQATTLQNASSIPDIVLTAEDLPVFSNQPLPACSMSGDMATQHDLSSSGINPLSYLGDSFDASTDLFTAEDALKLGLDPLEIEELQMLADASIITDPATEDSFRLERQ